MLPILLDIENFYCHSKSIIDFNDFSAAVIVGKINGNDKFSNGAGKSTIFAAIKYVLFNEVDTTSLEKVIKHNSDSCKVSFEFLSSLDNQIYKIIRFRGRRPGAEVRLFRKTISGDWDDLTQRTSTDTDKEIIKIIKINYRTFSNSVLFAQGDISGIAAMTPRERKTALKEALQLGAYSKYEKAIKKKADELTKEIEKTKTIISTIGNPDSDISEFSKKIELISPFKIEIEKILFESENNLSLLTKEVAVKQKELLDLSERISNDNKKIIDIEKEICPINIEINKYSIKILELEKQVNYSFSKAKSLSQEIKQLKSTPVIDEISLKNDIDLLRNDLSEQQSDFKQLTVKHKELKIPLTEEAICKHCRQSVDPEARIICQAAIDSEVKEIEIKLSNIKETVPKKQSQLLNLENKLEANRISIISLKEKEFLLEKEKADTISSSSILEEFSNLKKMKELDLKAKEYLKSELLKEKCNNPLKSQEEKINIELNKLQTNLKTLLQEKKYNLEKLSSSSNEEAVLTHKLEQRLSDKKKLNSLKESLNKLEYSFILHQKVTAAFGPSGIPALITHTILDDYQIESNNILDNLRPGLRLQFLTQNERNDGEMSDTLEITYFLNNTELEFSQLSGAQKLLVSLSLRLGLAAVISKRLGIDLKMILIDEADQSLDSGALEAFEKAIKELQKDYKILVITHNDELKLKFSHAIVVEQDNKLNSVAKLSNGW